MKNTTSIKVNGERWNVPRGFGKVYLREAKAQLKLIGQGRPGQIIHDVIAVMRLVGFEPTVEAVADWPLRKRIEAVIYAATVYARAGDNPVQRHPELSWLPKSWQGPWAGEGAFGGPTPTVIA